jgi:hypothetical protein
MNSVLLTPWGNIELLLLSLPGVKRDNILFQQLLTSCFLLLVPIPSAPAPQAPGFFRGIGSFLHLIQTRC